MEPAIFAGIDPADGKFFVAKKSVFNIDPKLYKSIAEIDADNLSAALNSKFKVAFEEFSKLGIKDVLQGDLMFTDDVSTETIDGKSFYTFQPNTIVYAVDVNSDFGKKIKNAKIGVVWHTTYRGKSLPDMKHLLVQTSVDCNLHQQYGWMMQHTKMYLVRRQ